MTRGGKESLRAALGAVGWAATVTSSWKQCPKCPEETRKVRVRILAAATFFWRYNLSDGVGHSREP
jgi:hypothetical protein